MSLIDNYLLRLEGNRKVRVPNMYYTTDLTRLCQRNAYYSIIYDESAKRESLRIFAMGNEIEDFYLEVLRNTPGIKVIATQLPARYYNKERGYEVHGRADCLCLHEDSVLVLHEIKSAKTASWKNSPNEEHSDQIQFYINVLGLANGMIDVVDKSIMLQGRDPRNTGEDKSPDTHYPIIRDEAVYSKLIERADQLHEAVITKIVPPMTQCYQCKGYCDYIEQCLKDTPEETNEDPTKPDKKSTRIILGKDEEEKK